MLCLLVMLNYDLDCVQYKGKLGHLPVPVWCVWGGGLEELGGGGGGGPDCRVQGTDGQRLRKPCKVGCRGSSW